MRSLAVLVFALSAVACVSGQSAHNGAVRFVNAVPDAPRMNMSVDGTLKAAGFDYGTGSSFAVMRAGAHEVKIDEILPPGSDPTTKSVATINLDQVPNDEMNLIVTGSEQAGTVHVLQVPTVTKGVSTGMTRLQFVHATEGGAPFDIYVTTPDGVIGATAPLFQGLAYGTWTAQQEVTGGASRIVLTEPGDPSAVLLDSGRVFLTLEGSLLITVVQNPSVDASAARPFALVLLSGVGSGTVLDKDTKSTFRLVNASPGAYSLDVFLNSSTVDNTARQVCDPSTSETDTVLELCALPYLSVGGFNTVTASSYEVKIQETGVDAMLAQSLLGSFAAGAASTGVVLGINADTAIASSLLFHPVIGGRRIATQAQLRIVNASIAAVNLLAGDPTTDRLELYIMDAGASLADEDPDFVNVVLGSDTGYTSQMAGVKQVVLVRADTATPDAAPEVLLTRQVTLANSGIYTLIISDSTGAVQPLQFLSIEDDPGPP